MHVAYHKTKLVVVYFTSAEQTTFNISTTLRYHSALPSFLPYLHHRMCVRGGENNDGYRVRLKIGVRSLLHRKVNLLRLLVVMCLFLSMVVWQPFQPYWRYIIARVSEMHFAYHTSKWFVVYLHQRNKQATTLRIFWICLRGAYLHYISFNLTLFSLSCY
jgi:hypothetical protein